MYVSSKVFHLKPQPIIMTALKFNYYYTLIGSLIVLLNSCNVKIDVKNDSHEKGRVHIVQSISFGAPTYHYDYS